MGQTFDCVTPEKQRQDIYLMDGKNESELEIVATYNLLFNASLMVEEGLGYAVGFDKIINTSGNSNLCFCPLSPQKDAEMSIIWKKYQIFSKASEKFMMKLKEF